MTAHEKFFEHNGKRISYREAEVLLCCANNLTVKQTASVLCRSHKTIQRHHENLHTRFDLRGYNSLVCFASKLLPELEKWVTLPIKMG
jgi:DNA-binding CsgD family transcriptional regulator